MLLLSLHLHNINQDRLAAMMRREGLRKELEFGLVHQNLGGGFIFDCFLCLLIRQAECIEHFAYTAVAISALRAGQLSNNGR